MAKDLLNDKKSRDPLSMRKAVIPVDFYNPEKSEIKDDDESKAINRTERSNHSEQPNGVSESNKPSTLLEELMIDYDNNKRSTERYSFEIYTDQKFLIEEIQFLYRKKSGGKKKISASRIIREAIGEHLAKMLEILKDS